MRTVPVTWTRRRRWRAAVSLLCVGLVLAPTLGAAQTARTSGPAGVGLLGLNPQPDAAGDGADAASGVAGAALAPERRAVEEIRASNESAEVANGAAREAEERIARAARATNPSAPRPTEFQRFVETSVGRLLPIYGRDLFANPPSTFAPVVDVAPAADYVIGPGDELLIRGWGQVNMDVRTVVARDGTISIPRVGVIPVSGVRLQELPAALERAIGRYYKNFQLSVTLGKLRSVQVFVVGHAQQPGVYTVSSISTLLNALLAAGGPSATGSMRMIQLRRGAQTVATVDLYDILLKGDKSHDQRLQPGDVIFIPPVGPMAAVAGPVKVPAIYELRADNTTIEELIGYAGGPATTASSSAVLLERLDATRGRVDEDLLWNDTTRAIPLRDGDVVMLRRVSGKFFNAVTVRGSVVTPFRTAWRPGLKVSDLIPDATALISAGYWARAAARAYPTTRAHSSNTDPNVAQEQTEARVKTEVANLVDEVNWDYAVIERLDRTLLQPRLVSFNLGKAVLEKDPANDLPLEPGDIVTVFSQGDLPAPIEKRSAFVRIEGEVVTPGVYQVKPGEMLRDVVQRAGGLTPQAYLFGSEFTRESVRRAQQDRLDDIASRAEQDLERASKQQLARALSAEDAAAVRTQAEAQRRTIERLRTVRATGRMVLGIAPNASSPKDLPNFELEDGDRLFVAPLYSAVGVYGSVYNTGNFLYRPDKHLEDYLQLAGGATRGADTGSIYLVRADGSVIAKTQSGWFSRYGATAVMPNDTIVVPEEFDPTSWVKELKDWAQILSSFGLAAAAVKVLSQ